MKQLATFLLLALFALTSLHAFEEGDYYYVSSRFQGEEKVLSVVKGGQVAKVELGAKRDVKGGGSQLWKVTPWGQGYYRLTTKLRGDEYSLDVVGDDPENDQIQLVKSGNFSGQSWKITELKDGYFRLTTELKGPSLSLDVCNEGDKSKMVGLIRSNDSSGQFWKFTKASGGKKNEPAAPPPTITRAARSVGAPTTDQQSHPTYSH